LLNLVVNEEPLALARSCKRATVRCDAAKFR
jgi:hypothetical protein